MKNKWQLRNGKIISDKQMTLNRLRTADMYDGIIPPPLPIHINHRLAQRIREMTNSEYVRHFGTANRKTPK